MADHDTPPSGAGQTVEQTVAALSAALNAREQHSARRLQVVRQLLDAEIERLLRRDELTGLLNRSSLEHDYKTAYDNYKNLTKVKRSGGLLLAFIEINHFKGVNDRFGYAQANRYLEVFAAALDASAQSLPRAAAYRAHGDEFFLIAQYPKRPTSEEVTVSLEGIVAQLDAATHRYGGLEVRATVSAGWWLVELEQVAEELRRRRAQMEAHLAAQLGDNAFSLVEPCLQRAVEVAKQRSRQSDRSEIFEYEAGSSASAKVHQRAYYCPESGCATKFDLFVARDKFKDEQPIHCPNCGHGFARRELEEASYGELTEPAVDEVTLTKVGKNERRD